MSTKHVLIVTWGFLPYNASIGGCLRMLTLADFLQRAGYQVHIIANRHPSEHGYFGYRDLVDQLDVHYADGSLNRIISRISSNWHAAHMHTLPSQLQRTSARLLGWRPLRRLLVTLVRRYTYPDPSGPVFRPQLANAEELMNRYPIELVITSGPPHGVHRVGLIIKRRLGKAITWVIDYRDSWTRSSGFAQSALAQPLRRRIWRLEQTLLSTCDNFLHVSPAILTKLDDLGDELKSKAGLVMNGFTRAAPCPGPRPSDPVIRIGHFGRISDKPGSERNPQRFVDMVARLQRDGHPIEVHFFGITDFWHITPDKYPFVHTHGKLDHHEALERMCDMDWLLVLHDKRKGADEVVTGKLFDYIAVRRPVLCVGPGPMDAKQIVEYHGLGMTADLDDPDGVQRVLLKLFEREFPLPPTENLDLFSRDHQYQRLLDALTPETTEDHP